MGLVVLGFLQRGISPPKASEQDAYKTEKQTAAGTNYKHKKFIAEHSPY
jgi:hypothetical protein